MEFEDVQTLAADGARCYQRNYLEFATYADLVDQVNLEAWQALDVVRGLRTRQGHPPFVLGESVQGRDL